MFITMYLTHKKIPIGQHNTTKISKIYQTYITRVKFLLAAKDRNLVRLVIG